MLTYFLTTEWYIDLLQQILMLKAMYKINAWNNHQMEYTVKSPFTHYSRSQGMLLFMPHPILFFWTKYV